MKLLFIHHTKGNNGCLWSYTVS